MLAKRSIAAVACTMVVLGACADESVTDVVVSTAPTVPGPDVVDVLTNDGRFATLVSAIDDVDLQETLRGPGPYTIFAPTDDAFAALPQQSVARLGLGQNQQQLRGVLMLHVVPRDLRSIDFVSAAFLETLGGEPVQLLQMPDGSWQIGNSKIVQTDIPATNGVVHVIDAVILPAPKTGG